jgi:hypothetical protein
MASVTLSQIAHSVVVGSLLGDAYIDKHNSLQIEHGFQQSEYVQWKYQVLHEVAGKPPKVVSRFGVRYAKVYQSLRFYSRCVMSDFRAVFYAGNRKIVPSNLSDLIDEIALAVWFMDDGSRGAHTLHGVVINTSSFSSDEQLLLQRMLSDRFDVSVNIYHVGKGFQLYVSASSYWRFYNLVQPYVIPQMAYKLVDPVTTEFRNTE